MKKIFIWAGLGFSGLILLVVLALSATLFYIESDHCSHMIQQQINTRIPGSIAWKGFHFSLLKGEISLENFQLTLDGEELAGIDRVDIAVDLSRVKQRELVIRQLSIDTPRATLLLTKEHQLNILKAFPESKPGDERGEEGGSIDDFPFNVIVESLMIKQGRFEYRSVPDGMSARLDALNISGRGNLLAKTAHLILTTGAVRFQQPGVNCHIEKIALETEYLVDAVPAFSLSMESDAADLLLKGSMDHLFEEPHLDLTLDVHLTTADLMKVLSLQQDITGDVDLNATVSGTISDPVVQCRIEYPDGTIMGREIKKMIFDGGVENREVSIAAFEFDHPHAKLTAKGGISLAAVFPDGFMGKKIHPEKISWDITMGGEAIEPGKILEVEAIKGVSGNCSFNAHFAGNMDNPRADLAFQGERIAYLDYPAVDADVDLSLLDGVVELRKMDIASCGARLQVGGSIKVMEDTRVKGERKPGEGQGQRQRGADVDVESTYTLMASPQFNITAISRGDIDIAQCLKQLTFLGELPIEPIEGKLGFRSRLKGTPENPALNLELTVSDLNAAGEHIQNIDLTADYRDKKLQVQSLEVRLAKNNTVTAKGWVDEKQHFNLNLDSRGIDLTLIQAIEQNAPLKGVASCSVSAMGSFDAPQVQGKIALRQVEVMEKPFEDFTADFDLKNQQLTLRGKLNFDIDAAFDLQSRDFSAKALFRKTDLLPWLTFAGIQDIEGRTTGNIELKGNADTPDKITALCDIGELVIRHQKHEHAEIRAEKVKIWSDGDAFKVEEFTTLLPEKGEVTLSASGKVAGEIRAKAKARIPVGMATLFVPDMLSMEGTVIADLEGKMDLRQGVESAEVDAVVALKDVGVVLPDDLGRVHRINGTITGDLNHIEINRIKGMFGTGEFQLTGKTQLKDFMPADIRLSLTTKAIPVNMVEGLAAEVHSDILFQGNPEEEALISGNIVIENAQWTRDFNVEKTLVSTLTTRKKVRKGGQEVQKSNSFLEKIHLDMAVKGETPIIVNNNLAYMEIHPDIKVQGTAAAPVVSGRSEINPGTINYQATEFTLTRGIIDFVNPYAIEPELDIESQRTVREWNVMLAISGTPDNLNFKLSSDPRLEDGDIISLLLRGKTVSELINAEGGTTLSTAGMLSQVAASAVSDNLKSATGLDIFEVGFGNNPDDNGLADMNVTVGKNITDKVTVKYGAETEDGEMVHKTSAEYKMTDNVSVTGFQDSAGQFGGEVRYRLEFR